MELNIQKEIHKLSAPYLIVDATTLMIADANHAAVALFGYSSEELLKMHVFKMIPEFVLSMAKENAELFVNQKMYFGNSVYKTMEGKLLKLRIVAHRISFNDKDCWQVEVKRGED